MIQTIQFAFGVAIGVILSVTWLLLVLRSAGKASTAEHKEMHERTIEALDARTRSETALTSAIAALTTTLNKAIEEEQ